MILDIITEPVDWLVIFHEKSTPWVERITPGRFKHISLAGFVPDAKAWTHISWDLGRMRVSVVADNDFEAWLPTIAHDAAGVLRMPAPEFDHGPWRPRIGLTCTSMALHVLGIRGGALLPDSLWRLLLAHGAEIVTDGQPGEPESSRTDRRGEGGAADGEPGAA